jgi:hypothetical protein
MVLIYRWSIGTERYKKKRGLEYNSSPVGQGVLRGVFVHSYFYMCGSTCVSYNRIEGFGIHSCWHDEDLDKDIGHDEGYAGYGELRRGFSLDE